MTVAELRSILADFDPSKPIYLEGAEDGLFRIEPITESCDDDTVVGYVITFSLPQ